jgi:hypothetical protein
MVVEVEARRAGERMAMGWRREGARGSSGARRAGRALGSIATRLGVLREWLAARRARRRRLRDLERIFGG